MSRTYLKRGSDRLVRFQAVNGKDDKISNVRQAFATAWFVLFSKYDGLTARCATNDKFKKAFAPVKQEYDRIEAAIAAVETARGVKNVTLSETLPSPTISTAMSGGSTGGVNYKYADLKTGQPVPNGSYP
jgi:hypothetical protein